MWIIGRDARSSLKEVSVEMRITEGYWYSYPIDTVGGIIPPQGSCPGVLSDSTLLFSYISVNYKVVVY